MSKSRGNSFTLRDLLDKGASPAAIRLELIKTHYRSNANFTFQGMTDAQRQIDRWARLEGWLKRYEQCPLTGAGHLSAALGPFRDALGDDLNVAGALGVLNEAVSRYDTEAVPPPSGDGKATYASELDALKAINSVLGVLDLARDGSIGSDLDPGAIEAMLAERETARKAGDWATADRIRNALLEMGVAIKDSPEGTSWSRIVK
jgi:cysteinyl-tRNA synthetase